jgi:hypothetical protein
LKNKPLILRLNCGLEKELDFIISDMKAKTRQVVQGMDNFHAKDKNEVQLDNLGLHQPSRFGLLHFLLLFFGFFYLLRYSTKTVLIKN